MTRAPVPDLEAGERELHGALAHYLSRVLRLPVGSRFTAFDPARGLEADAVVIRSSGDGLAVRIGLPREGKVHSPEPLVWIQGFAKADKCDAVVRDATELGATHVVIAETQRSVVKLDAVRGAARAERWRRIAREAARQCGRSDAPTVDAPKPWSDALSASGGDCARFCLYEGATEALAPPLFDALAEGRALVFACGAEGGLEDSEVELAAAAGWTIASLGPLALRTETVAAAVLGAVRVWRGLFVPPTPGALAGR